jgi:hypothetical protein
LYYKRKFIWDSTAYDGTVAVYFEAAIATGQGNSTYARAALYTAAGVRIENSIVSATGPNTNGVQLVRSGDISGDLVNGTEYYLWGTADANGCMYGARLIIVQSGTYTKTRTDVPL